MLLLLISTFCLGDTEKGNVIQPLGAGEGMILQYWAKDYYNNYHLVLSLMTGNCPTYRGT